MIYFQPSYPRDSPNSNAYNTVRYNARYYIVFIVRHNAQNVKVKIGVKEMNQPLTKSAEAVQTALDEIGIICKVLELPSSTRTASDAASSIGCDISQIIKSLVFKTESTDKPILVFDLATFL